MRFLNGIFLLWLGLIQYSLEVVIWRGRLTNLKSFFFAIAFSCCVTLFILLGLWVCLLITVDGMQVLLLRRFAKVSLLQWIEELCRVLWVRHFRKGSKMGFRMVQLIDNEHLLYANCGL